MAFKLPLYFISGYQPISWEHTEDGGSTLLAWDFEKKKMTREAVDFDAVLGGADTQQVTKKEFDEAVRKLKNSS